MCAETRELTSDGFTARIPAGDTDIIYLTLTFILDIK